MCEAELWMTIDPSDWRNVPFIEGRPAQEEDVKCGRAVFYIEGAQSKATEGISLPALARLKMEDGKSEKVIIIQVESSTKNDDVIAGYRTFAGGNGVATLRELEIIEVLNPR
jgi:hypothetical protein